MEPLGEHIKTLSANYHSTGRPSAQARSPASILGGARSVRASASICEACRKGVFSAHFGLFDGAQRSAGGSEDKSVGGHSYVTSRKELGSRTDAGCQWCQLVLALLSGGRSEDDEARSHQPLDIRVARVHPPGEPNRTPTGTQYLSISVNNDMRFLGYVYATADDPAGAYIVARGRILDVGSRSSLALAKSAIVECVREHPNCIKFPNPPPFLPTRLIDCTDPNRPRLVGTEGTRGVYLALSYIWGDAQPYKTTTSNIATYANGIDPSSLLKTVRDAIQVTHALGFQYLWVDSICIIQDSVEDQQREIGRMRLVYRDAYCTIIAASAQRVSEGFLQHRSPSHCHTEDDAFSPDITLPLLCPSSVDDRADLAESSSPTLGEIHISPTWMHGNGRNAYNPAMEPISSRGWCMQEYFMSPRSLLFASHTLQFRCQAATHNIGGAYHDMAHEKRLPDILFLEHPPLLERGSKEWRELRFAWLEVLADYTRRSITMPSDKLVACGGIAEEFQRVLRTDYLAGLWRDTLLTDLLWRKADANTLRPLEYRAPSWSWAAVDGLVHTRVPHVEPGSFSTLTEVIRCDVALEDAALPFGRVSGASLVLRTPLIACVWDTRLAADPYPGHYLRLSSSHHERTEIGEVERFGTVHIDDEGDTHVQQLWAISIDFDRRCIGGIVVALASAHGTEPKGEMAKYRRVGYFHTRVFPSPGPFDWVEGLPLVELELV